MSEVSSVAAALTLILGVPLNIYAAIMLWRLHRRRPTNLAILERAVVALAILLLTILFGLIFLNNDTVPPWLALPWTKVLTRLMVLAVAVGPAGYWLLLYRKD